MTTKLGEVHWDVSRKLMDLETHANTSSGLICYSDAVIQMIPVIQGMEAVAFRYPKNGLNHSIYFIGIWGHGHLQNTQLNALTIQATMKNPIANGFIIVIKPEIEGTITS